METTEKMKFYRKYCDEEKAEEITEEIARDRLSGYYNNIDDVIASMTSERVVSTGNAVYFCEL